jgi:hypothetical protein
MTFKSTGMAGYHYDVRKIDGASRDQRPGRRQVRFF